MFGKNIEFTMNCRNSDNTHTDSEKVVDILCNTSATAISKVIELNISMRKIMLQI